MTLQEWRDKNNDYGLCAQEMETSDAKSILVEEVLGKDWAISYPANGKQAMAEIVYSVVAEVKRLRTPWWKRWKRKTA